MAANRTVDSVAIGVLRRTAESATERALSFPLTEATESLVRAISLVTELLHYTVAPNPNNVRALARSLTPNARAMLHSLLRDIAEPAYPVDVASTSARRLAEWTLSQVRYLERELPPEIVDVARGWLASASDRAGQMITATKLAGIEATISEQDSVLEQATESASAARELVGDAAASELGAEFAKHAVIEGRQSFAWSLIVLLSLASVCVLSMVLLRNVSGLDWAAQLARVAATVPLVGIAVYAARVAGHHRDTARWASTRAVQLKSLRAYSDALGAADRDALRLEFGRRVFTQLEADSEAASPVLVDPATVLQQATEVLKSAVEVVKSATK